MRSPATLVCAVLALVAPSCGGGSEVSTVDGAPASSGTPADTPPPDGIDGLWMLVSADVDGQSVASGLFLEIDGLAISGETICEQSFGGEMGGPFVQTEEGCDEEGLPGLDFMDERVMSVLAGVPAIEDDRLVFTGERVRLTYEKAVAVTAEDLFAALNDEALAADSSEIFLDPEAGGSHRDFQKLARLEHSSTEASFFVGTTDELICFVVSSDVAALTACLPPREMAIGTFGHELSTRDGPTGMRAALIPDAFVDAAANLADLGVANGNVLVVDPDVTAGEYVLTNEAGDQFVLSVPG